MTIARRSLGIALCVALLLNAGAAGAQQGQAPLATPPQGTTIDLSTQTSPENLDRIRRGLAHESGLKLDEGQLKIYVEIIAKWPSFAEVTKGYDFMNGPTGKGNPMSHKEFLDMVTPREMYSSVGIQPLELLTSAFVSYFGQKAIAKGLKEIQELDAERDQKKIAQIRAQIDAELAALAALKGGI